MQKKNVGKLVVLTLEKGKAMREGEEGELIVVTGELDQRIDVL